MGASLVYLESPNEEISFEEGSNDYIKFVAAQMQGWRINMEDAHIADLQFHPERQQSLFCVFDGHGGKEVALYSSAHYSDILRESVGYKNQKYEEALKESFLSVDVHIELPDGKEELTKMKKSAPPNKSPIFKILG